MLSTYLKCYLALELNCASVAIVDAIDKVLGCRKFVRFVLQEAIERKLRSAGYCPARPVILVDPNSIQWANPKSKQRFALPQERVFIILDPSKYGGYCWSSVWGLYETEGNWAVSIAHTDYRRHSIPQFLVFVEKEIRQALV